MTPRTASRLIVARSLALVAADRRDAHAMSVYARLTVKQHARRMILSGLAGFNRNVEG